MDSLPLRPLGSLRHSEFLFKTLVSFSNCLCWVPSTPVLQLHGDFIQFSLLSHVLLDQRLGLLKVALMVAAELAEAENTLAHLGGH